MRNMLLVVSFCCLALSAGASPKAILPFGDYPASHRFIGRPAPVSLHTPMARMFRTVLREEERSGPNFAGHYRLAIWGAGAGGREFAIIDSLSGRVYFPAAASAVNLTSDDLDEPIQFRRDSRLLILAGIVSGRGEDGYHYYVWTGRRLQELHLHSRHPGSGN